MATTPPNGTNNINSNQMLFDKIDSLIDALNILIRDNYSNSSAGGGKNNNTTPTPRPHKGDWSEFLKELRIRNKQDADIIKSNNETIKALSDRIDKYKDRLDKGIIKNSDTQKLYKQAISETKFNRTQLLTEKLVRPGRDVNGAVNSIKNTSTGEHLANTISKVFPKISAGMGNMFGKIASKITGFLSKSTGPIGLIASILKGIVSMMIDIYNASANIGKRFGISKEHTQSIFTNLNDTLRTSSVMGVTINDMVDALDSMSTLMGGTGEAMVYYLSTQKQSLETQSALTKIWQLTNDESAQYVNMLKLAGVGENEIAGSMYKLIENTNTWSGKLINAKDVIKQISNAGSDMITWMHTIPDAITHATFEAIKLGTTLTGLGDISKNILSFQSSVRAVMEANVLTGRSMNFNMARFMALQGDLAGAAREIGTQLGGYAEFNKLNIIQQESVAKSIGLSSKQLADMLVKQEGLAKASAMLGVQLTDTSKISIDQQKQLLKSSDAAINAFVKNYQQMTLQEQIQALQLKVAQTLAALLAKLPIESMVNGMMTIAAAIIRVLGSPFIPSGLSKSDAEKMARGLEGAKLDTPDNDVNTQLAYDNSISADIESRNRNTISADIESRNRNTIRGVQQHTPTPLDVRSQSLYQQIGYQSSDMRNLNATIDKINNTMDNVFNKGFTGNANIVVKLGDKEIATQTSRILYNYNSDTGGYKHL